MPLNLWNKSPPRWMESLCLWRPDAFGNCWPLEIPVALRSHALLTNLDFSGFFMKRVRHNGKFVGKYWDPDSAVNWKTSWPKLWDGFKPSGSCSPTTRKESWLFQPNRWKRASGIPHQQFGSTVVTWLLISGQKGLVWPNSWENIFFLGGCLGEDYGGRKCLSRLPCYQPLSKKGWCYIWEILWESHGFSWNLCHAQVPIW